MKVPVPEEPAYPPQPTYSDWADKEPPLTRVHAATAGVVSKVQGIYEYSAVLREAAAAAIADPLTGRRHEAADTEVVGSAAATVHAESYICRVGAAALDKVADPFYAYLLIGRGELAATAEVIGPADARVVADIDSFGNRMGPSRLRKAAASVIADVLIRGGEEDSRARL